MLIPEEEKRGAEKKHFKETMVENIPHLMKNINFCIQEPQQTQHKEISTKTHHKLLTDKKC